MMTETPQIEHLLAETRALAGLLKKDLGEVAARATTRAQRANALRHIEWITDSFDRIGRELGSLAAPPAKHHAPRHHADHSAGESESSVAEERFEPAINSSNEITEGPPTSEMHPAPVGENRPDAAGRDD